MFDIKEILLSSFANAGMSDVIDSDLNNHSTISLHMKERTPAIHIKYIDDSVWMWAKVCDYTQFTLLNYRDELMELMLAHNEVFYMGQPCLYPTHTALELRAQVKYDSLESQEAFLSTLEKFLTILNNYCSLIE